MVARHRNVLHRIADGRRAGRSSQCTDAALQRCNALFEYIGGGVHQTGVNIAAFCQAKAACRLCGVFKDVRGCRINRYSAGIGCGVGLLLPDVYLKCFKTIIFISHITLLLLIHTNFL
ncbi:hypothetical protein SDC9_185151 [bioreactor metagenome]|uniref:Uncharacterized protein n=1 Tax=bioreactor metagenome TaxID=1076179 RepID=A0A645HF44_9ZZZZ